MALTVSARTETFPLASVFRISRGARTESHVVVCEITDGDVVARGESFPYTRYGESLDSVIAQIEAQSAAVSASPDRERLRAEMPAGAARNAIDCALWDLEAKRSGKRAWTLAGLPAPAPLTTVYTLGVDTPEAMAASAAKNAARPMLKLKMTGDGADLARVEAIHQAAPDTTLVVDANEGWTPDIYSDLAPKFARLKVVMIEQPLPASDDGGLAGIERPVPVCADESCHDTATLDALVGKYDMINIKLDKTGGLTEALRLRDAAVEMGFEVMVGCMVGSSLAMAPGIVVAQGAKIVDLDGPLLLAEDRPDGLRYDGSTVHPSAAALWG